MTQECGRKSNWHKKLVKARLWNAAKPFGILGEPDLIAAVHNKLLFLQSSMQLFMMLAGRYSCKAMTPVVHTCLNASSHVSREAAQEGLRQLGLSMEA